jgi:hypothetical protein
VGLAGLGAAASTGAADVVERVVAVVGDDPVLLSEVRLLSALRGVDEGAATEALVDERLMLREASRLPQAAAGPEEVERLRADLLARQPDAGRWPPYALAERIRREATVLKFVEFRFRPQVRLSEEDVRAAYEQAYGGDPAAPRFEDAAASLRDGLARAGLARRIEEWVRELRAGATVRYNR